MSPSEADFTAEPIERLSGPEEPTPGERKGWALALIAAAALHLIIPLALIVYYALWPPIVPVAQQEIPVEVVVEQPTPKPDKTEDKPKPPPEPEDEKPAYDAPAAATQEKVNRESPDKKTEAPAAKAPPTPTPGAPPKSEAQAPAPGVPVKDRRAKRAPAPRSEANAGGRPAGGPESDA